jgi:hypothetical protein
LTVALVGVIPVALRYSDEAKWFTVGYCCLVIGAIATNAEALFLGDLLNFVEHGVGLLGSGLAFAYAAYERRESLLGAGSAGSETPEATEVAEG